MDITTTHYLMDTNDLLWVSILINNLSKLLKNTWLNIKVSLINPRYYYYVRILLCF